MWLLARFVIFIEITRLSSLCRLIFALNVFFNLIWVSRVMFGACSCFLATFGWLGLYFVLLLVRVVLDYAIFVFVKREDLSADFHLLLVAAHKVLIDDFLSKRLVEHWLAWCLGHRLSNALGVYFPFFGSLVCVQLKHLQCRSEFGHNVDLRGPDVHAADEESQIVTERQAFPGLVEESVACLDVARLYGSHRFECSLLEFENMGAVRCRGFREYGDWVPICTLLARVLPFHNSLNLWVLLGAINAVEVLALETVDGPAENGSVSEARLCAEASI